MTDYQKKFGYTYNPKIGRRYLFASFVVLMFIAMMLVSGISFGQVKKDTTVKYNYLKTYDPNYLAVKMDSILKIGVQFIGSTLSKDDANNIIGQFSRLVIATYNSGKLDSVIVKSK